MPAKFSAFALFCSDIRQEKGESDTIVGVMKDNLILGEIPNTIPKLSLYIRVIFPVDSEIESVSTFFVDAMGEEVRFNELTIEHISEHIDRAKAKGAPTVTFITRIHFAAFPIPKAGRIIVYAEGDSGRVVAGHLDVKASETANSPEELPEQSQPDGED